MQDLIDEPQPFKLTPGFIAFVAALALPMIVGFAIYIGAWAVSAEVHAAEASNDGTRTSVSNAPPEKVDVAGWKKSLIGICPVH